MCSTLVMISLNLLAGSYILHARHARRGMVHHSIGSSVVASPTSHAPHSASMRLTEAGEGVGTQSKGDCLSPVTDETRDIIVKDTVPKLDANSKD